MLRAIAAAALVAVHTPGLEAQQRLRIGHSAGREIISDSMRSMRIDNAFIDHGRGIIYVEDAEHPVAAMAFSLEDGRLIGVYAGRWATVPARRGSAMDSAWRRPMPAYCWRAATACFNSTRPGSSRGTGGQGRDDRGCMRRGGVTGRADVGRRRVGASPEGGWIERRLRRASLERPQGVGHQREMELLRPGDDLRRRRPLRPDLNEGIFGYTGDGRTFPSSAPQGAGRGRRTAS